jgi:hypothetical protein
MQSTLAESLLACEAPVLKSQKIYLPSLPIEGMMVGK